jgi:hypothetical protein
MRTAARRLLQTFALLVLVALAGCASKPAPAVNAAGSLALLTRGGCVFTTAMRANLDAALKSIDRPGDYQFIDLDTLPKTDARSGYPTPTLLLDDVDLFGMPRPVPPFPEPT